MKVDYCQDDLILKVFPTVGGCFSEAWNILKKNFLLLLALVIISGVIEIPLGYEHMGFEDKDSFKTGFSYFKLLSFVYYMLIVTPFNYGIDWVFLRAAKNKEVQFEEILNGFKKFLFVILSHLLVIGIVGIGVLLLIIPGIYLACKLIFVPYLIMDKKVDPIQAVKLSYYMSNGYFWTIFGMALLSFLIIILGVVCLFVGVFVSLVWVNSAFAVLYRAVDELHAKEACLKAGINLELINE